MPSSSETLSSCSLSVSFSFLSGYPSQMYLTKINFFMGDSSNLIPPHTRTHGGTNNYKIPLRNSNSDLAQPERVQKYNAEFVQYLGKC